MFSPIELSENLLFYSIQLFSYIFFFYVFYFLNKGWPTVMISSPTVLIGSPTILIGSPTVLSVDEPFLVKLQNYLFFYKIILLKEFKNVINFFKFFAKLRGFFRNMLFLNFLNFLKKGWPIIGDNKVISSHLTL